MAAPFPDFYSGNQGGRKKKPETAVAASGPAFAPVAGKTALSRLCAITWEVAFLILYSLP
jgi:hypothetical protein